ncbi:hypothetical protein HGRIS_013453 [Hohenbuehelia grisea]|uniref:Helicase ATP-binding domain-containing protein n=1 Tax=Hohenbuehelia grisea TaxID=104357 RepID=A0ABR3IVS1_9AGAR
MKRKAKKEVIPSADSSSDRSPKKPKSTKTVRKNLKSSTVQTIDTSSWPEYLQSLNKVFKALNTVLAFVSSRKQLATTFPVVRSSVEALLKQPLELAQVAEIKAILPEVIKFGYIPQDELRIHGESMDSKRRESPDFSMPSSSSMTLESQEHVLILEFADNSKGKKSGPNDLYSAPSALSPAAVKKLIENRNSLFLRAVNDLIVVSSSGEDPVSMIQAAGRDHIPIDPSAKSLPDLIKASASHLTVPDHDNRPSIEAVLSEVKVQTWYREQIVESRQFEPRLAKEGQLSNPLSEPILDALQSSRGISSLYVHQTSAIDAIEEGHNVIVSTSTASGKSVIYQVPVLRFLVDNPDSTAIFVYPTKALAQDQKAAMEQLINSCVGLEHIVVSTYDGDTPQDQRRGIRETASVIFTNFDMIHTSMLPHEELWRRFLENLKLFAVDELHYYTGLFGSHVAQIMRRFRRVCAAIGNRRTRFVSCSATIGNPERHMRDIFGVDNVVEVTEDGAPSGRKDFIIWQPPMIDQAVPALGRRSTISEATVLMRFLMKRGIRCILFCKIRKICELVSSP